MLPAELPETQASEPQTHLFRTSAQGKDKGKLAWTIFVNDC